MLSLVAILWFLGSLKYVLFWLYLWQLKEYHVGRFLAHFQTQKGQDLIFNSLLLIKLFLALLFFLESFLFFWILISLYFAESFLFFKSIIERKVKKPKFTVKAFFLTSFSFLITALYPISIFFISKNIDRFYVYILFFDILIPLIVSAIVLIFQPLFVLIRNIIIEKAKKKIEKIKKESGKLLVIGITGSYGKTSTKEFLAAILSSKFSVLKTEKHQNSEMGISQCILKNLTKDHEVFVVELGAYNKGGIKLLCNIIKPNIGIVTGVNEQHLALFGSFENLLSAEGGKELANSLLKDGLLVLNGDNKYCLELYRKTNLNTKAYAQSKEKIDPDIFADEVSVKRNHLSFVVLTKEGEISSFQINALGKHNVSNFLAAVLVAKHLGMSFEEILKASKNIKEEQSGAVLKEGKHGIDIIDSSYSANPSGVIADLDYLNTFPNKKVIIMPCLIELGEKSEEIHEGIGKEIGKICNLAIITTKEMIEHIKQGAMDSGMGKENILFIDNPKKIAMKILTFCTKGDAVLLEGRVPEKVLEILVEQDTN